MDATTRTLVDLVDSHGHRLYSLLAKLTANRDAADELLQDLFVRILRTTGVADAPNPEAYVSRAAINLAFDWRKRARRAPDLALLEEDVATDCVPLPDEVVSKEEVVRSLYDTMAALEPVPMDELYLHDPLDDRVFVDSETRGGGHQATARQHKPKPSETNFEAFWEHLQERYLKSHPKPTVTVEETR